MNNLLLIFVGGGLGSLARFGIAGIVQVYFKSIFPVATLFSNVISCLILALTISLFSEKLITEPGLRMLILTGFCGVFSTFSTFSYETLELMRSGNFIIAIANIVISISVCIGLIYFLTKHT